MGFDSCCVHRPGTSCCQKYGWRGSEKKPRDDLPGSGPTQEIQTQTIASSNPSRQEGNSNRFRFVLRTPSGDLLLSEVWAEKLRQETKGRPSWVDPAQ